MVGWILFWTHDRGICHRCRRCWSVTSIIISWRRISNTTANGTKIMSKLENKIRFIFLASLYLVKKGFPLLIISRKILIGNWTFFSPSVPPTQKSLLENMTLTFNVMFSEYLISLFKIYWTRRNWALYAICMSVKCSSLIWISRFDFR